MKKNSAKKIERRPDVIIMGTVLGLLGAAIVAAGIVYFDPTVWIGSVLIIVIGLTTFGFAATAIITGERAWILLDLISPL